MNQRWFWWWGVAGVFLLANLLLISGRTVPVWDADGQFYPYYVLVADFARAARVVYWDPWSNAGLPILGDPQVGIFSPIQFIVGFIMGGTSSGFITYWLLMWLLGGFGIVLLAHHFNSPPWCGCVVALGFLFCGIYTGHAEHVSWIVGFSFLPFIIWRLDAAICSRSPRSAVEAGALWGLSALAGYPGFTIITGCFIALWAIGRIAFIDEFSVSSLAERESAGTERQVPTLKFTWLILAILFLVGLIVLSPTYAAFFSEGAGYHTRVNVLSRESASQENALHPGALSTFASPYLAILKLHNRHNLWSYTDVSSCSIYAGAVVTVFAALALVNQPRNRWRWWLAFLGALFLAFALGRWLPLRGWLYDWFYPVRFFRHATIFRAYYLFIISVLALLALRDFATSLRSSDDRIWKQFRIVSFGIASGAILCFTLVSGHVVNAPRKIFTLAGYLQVLIAWFGLCGIALIGRRLRDRGMTMYISVMLLGLASSDTILTKIISLHTVETGTPEAIKRWERLDASHVSSLDLAERGLSRADSLCPQDVACKNNDQLITKTSVFDAYVTEYNYYHQEMVKHPILRKAAIGAERIWFSKNVCQTAVTNDSFYVFAERSENLGAIPLIIHPPEAMTVREDENQRSNPDVNQTACINELPPAENISVNLVKYTPNELVFDAETKTDGWLLVTDRWAKGWTCKVNGKRTAVYGGNFIFRAVHVTPGHNRISFAYRPVGFPWLVILSWMTLIVVTINSAHAVLNNRRMRIG